MGDVLSPEDEALLLLLAQEAAAKAAVSRPLAAYAVQLTKEARCARQEDLQERRRRVAVLRRWVEAATWYVLF